MEALRRVLRCKIHRATVTRADLEYEGSVTIPPDLMRAADLAEYEAVEVWNVSSGARFGTYAMLGQEGSRDVSINGAAAHHAGPGDKVIIAAFGYLPAAELGGHKPRIVFVDERNRIRSSRPEIPGPARFLEAVHDQS